LSNPGYLKIVTIGLDDIRSIEDVKIKLDKYSQRDTVKNIIQHKLGDTRQQSDLNYIANLSEGYPWMAVRFCNEVRKQGMFDLSRIPIENFVSKLIFGSRPEDETERNIIRACSVFSAFGFLDDRFQNLIRPEQRETLQKQMDFIRNEIYDGELTETKFRETCTKFLESDVIEKRGYFYVVKPTILAINLAADWLRNTNPDRIIRIINDLKGIGLDEKFVERLKDLDQLDKAKNLVKELWGPNSPFSTAEVLNTSWGSRLFRYVVEVNPKETAKAVCKTFGSMSKEQLLKIGEGRRNLIWALERLCFRVETFERAAKVLYLFAVSENEKWANNATHQFTQLFQLFLSGTATPLVERLQVISWGLSTNDEDYRRVAIQALGRALYNDQFSRMGGAEYQGSSAPLRDYHPLNDEIIKYCADAINMLTDLAISDSIHSELAMEKIASSIRYVSRLHRCEIIVNSVRRIIEARKISIWADALNNLKVTLEFEDHLPNDMVESIQNLINELTPSDLRSQILLKVSVPEWAPMQRDDDGNFINQPRLNAENFAKKLVDENTPWTDFVPTLLQGEQRLSFVFGHKIGELIADKRAFLNDAIDTLRSIPKESQNSEFIAGFLLGTNDKALCTEAIDKFIGTTEIWHHAFYITKTVASFYTDITKLFVLIDEFDFPITHFQHFQYGCAMDRLTNEEVLDLCNWICQHGLLGRWVALSLLYMYCSIEENKFLSNRDFFKKLIEDDNMIALENNNTRLDYYHWQETVQKLLTHFRDESLAIAITKQIVEVCAKPNFNFSADAYISNVIIYIFENYFEATWEYFGEGVMGDYLTSFHLENLIGSRNGTGVGRVAATLFKNPANYPILLEWCRKHKEIAPERIAHMMPLSVVENGETNWHPFSKSVIYEFGDSERFVRELSSNMGTFGAVGSSVPYYETQKKLLQQLIDHPIERIREWAEETIEYTERRIKLENLNDELRTMD
jgi:hypothetical protein